MRTVYDLIRHGSTLQVICTNCDNSRVFNHRFLMARGPRHSLGSLKFVCRKCRRRNYRMRIVDKSLGEAEPLTMQHFRGVYEKFLD